MTMENAQEVLNDMAETVNHAAQEAIKSTTGSSSEGLDPTSVAIGIGIGLLMSLVMTLRESGKKKVVLVNPSIEKENPKVATVCKLKDIEDLVDKSAKGKVSYCRCWRSKKFPFCDGAHRDYNTECGDNTGPLVVSKD